ncbi:Excinuclease ABC subunit A, partial [hydrothermal vent metagenome]
MKSNIVIKGAREHNLKNVSLEIPRNSLVVVTGLSGSGKSSLAFDTIYAEGQRRYVESLSAYARQFLERMEKPDVDYIEGLSPAISIEQKTTSRNPRSTVGTVTEIHDYLRLLFARAGLVHCHGCGREIASQTVSQMVDRVMELPEKTRIQVMAPVVKDRKGEYRKELDGFRSKGFVRVRVDGELLDLAEEIKLDKKRKHTIDLVLDRLIIKEGLQRRLADSLELALKMGEGVVLVEIPGGEKFLFSEKFSCVHCDISYPEIAPRMFSFNNPHGACQTCAGLGVTRNMSPDLVVPDQSLSLRDGAVSPWSSKTAVYYGQMLESLAKHYGFSMTVPFKKLSKKARNLVLYGSGEEIIKFKLKKEGRLHAYEGSFEGVLPNLKRRYEETESHYIREEMEQYMLRSTCEKCDGKRLRKEALAVRVGDLSIDMVSALSVDDAFSFFKSLKLDKQRLNIARRVLKEISERLGFLK